MTHLERSRPVLRRVKTEKSGELVVWLTLEGLRLREKGRRTWFGPISFGQLYLELVRREIEARKRARRTKRRARR